MGTLAINEVKKTMNPQDNQVNQNMNRQQNESMGFDKYVAIALIVGLIAGFIIGNSVGSSRTAKMSKTATTTDSVIYGNKDASTTANVNADITQGNLSTNSPAVGTPIGLGSSLQGGDWISVNNQTAGNNVIISKLHTDKSYWVAIRDSVSTTEKPFVLGAKRVQAGDYTDLSVYVSRAIKSGKSYDVVFYKDDGGAFNYDPSMLIMDGSQPVGTTFKVN